MRRKMDQVSRVLVLILLSFVSTAVSQNCSVLTDCGSCTSFSQATCYFCKTDNTCKPFTATTIFNFNTESCSKLQYFVGQCIVPTYGFAIIIAGGLLILLLICVCVCCCICRCLRRRNTRMKYSAQVNYHQEKAEINERRGKRKADRKVQYDAYRQKYSTGAFAQDAPYVKM